MDLTNILKAIDKFEINIAKDNCSLPYESSFAKLVSLRRCKGRVELLKQTAAYLVYKYGGINRVHINDIHEIIPNVREFPLTKAETNEIHAYLQCYFSFLITDYISDIRRHINGLSDKLKEIIETIQHIDNDSVLLNAMKITSNGIKIEDEFNHNEQKNSEVSRIVTTTPYFYWNYSPQKLVALEQLLLNAGFIKHNPNFNETFKSEKVLNEALLTRWERSRPEAYYLLYRIFNSVLYNRENIAKIADKLFVFNGKSCSEISRASFNKFYQKMQGNYFDEYIQKKLRGIACIADSILCSNKQISDFSAKPNSYKRVSIS